MKNLFFNIVFSVFVGALAFTLVLFVIGVKLYYRKTQNKKDPGWVFFILNQFETIWRLYCW